MMMIMTWNMRNTMMIMLMIMRSIRMMISKRIMSMVNWSWKRNNKTKTCGICGIRYGRKQIKKLFNEAQKQPCYVYDLDL